MCGPLFMKILACTVWILCSLPVQLAYANEPKGLTPVGAETAGNSDDSIPPWLGGLESTPGEFSVEEGYRDPFPGDRVLFYIDRQNISQYRAKLSDGLAALVERNKDFRIPVYRSRRSVTFPDYLLKQHRANGPKGCAINWEHCVVPYPSPQDGVEVMMNHLRRYRGGSIERSFDTVSVKNGRVLRIGARDTKVFRSSMDDPPRDSAFAYLLEFLSPPEFVGTIYMVHEPSDINGTRQAWVYNSGQRRVRRAPDLAYDNAQDGTDGLAVVDQYDGFNGAMDRYDWILLGKRELLIPYNNYKVGDKNVDLSLILGKKSLNPDYLRFELHRVWMIEARLKPGYQHIYRKRIFYIDEDAWAVALSESYDSKGDLWRVGIHSIMQFYDAVLPGYRFEYWQDLHDGSYVVTGLDNRYRDRPRFGKRFRGGDFTADALRRKGR